MVTFGHTMLSTVVRAAVERQPWPIAAAAAGWPGSNEIRDLAEAGVQEVVIAEPIEICDETAEQALGFLRFLRDCETFALRVGWRGCFGAGVPRELLSHLWPPSAAAGDEDGQHPSGGSEPYAFGRFYWRSGPGFVTVRDTRPARAAQRLTIADHADLRLFMAVQEPARVADYPSGTEAGESLRALSNEGIVLCLGEWALCLPCRMRFWPVPYMAI